MAHVRMARFILCSCTSLRAAVRPAPLVAPSRTRSFPAFLHTTRPLSQSLEPPIDDIEALEKERQKASKPKRKTPPKPRPKKELPELNEDDLDETFVRGGGPGGQVTNKTSNACSLIHRPTGIRVLCHETRSRETNRKLARRIMRNRVRSVVRAHLVKSWVSMRSSSDCKWRSAVSSPRLANLTAVMPRTARPALLGARRISTRPDCRARTAEEGGEEAQGEKAT
ncbi:hypothetical protein BJY59DRAFT_691669 [Rhodotorula toruloides]